MSDGNVALLLLVLCLVLGAAVNLSLLVSVSAQWWMAFRSKTNGPRIVIVRGTVRRILLRLILQTALIFQFGTRVMTGHSASPRATVLVVLIVVLVLAADAIGDMFDFRVLRWQLRDHRDDA